MKIESRKFNKVFEVDDDSVIRFPHGIIGNSGEKEFVLIEREQSPRIAWLQSVRNPELAFPVVATHELASEYPDVPLAEAVFAERIDAIDENTALLVVLTCQAAMNPTVNLTAPIVVNARTRQATQVILQGTRYSSRELLHMRPWPVEGSTSQPGPGGMPSGSSAMTDAAAE